MFFQCCLQPLDDLPDVDLTAGAGDLVYYHGLFLHQQCVLQPYMVTMMGKYCLCLYPRRHRTECKGLEQQRSRYNTGILIGLPQSEVGGGVLSSVGDVGGLADGIELSCRVVSVDGKSWL